MRIPLAKYGLREVLLGGGVLAAGAALGAVWWWPAVPVPLVALGFLLYFFRDPERRVPEGPGLVVSPADGVVVEAGETSEPVLLDGPAYKVAIFMSPLAVHVNRAPCDGRVERIERRRGRFHHARTDAAARENEAVALRLGEVEGRTAVVVRQVAGAMARRIVCAVREGDRLARGQRFGMIKLGSRLEVFVPLDAGFEPSVGLGQRVRAGETVLGRFR